MGTLVPTKIDRFDGGMTLDPRDPSSNTCQVCTNYDILTNPRQLAPYRQSESGDTAPTTSRKQNFCVALRTGTTYRLYSLGVKSGAGTAEVLMKDLTTVDTNDLRNAGWDTPANNQSTSGATSFNLFVYYKKVGLIFGARAGTHIWAFDPSSSAAWADSHQALTYSNIGQGLVHSKDDILYIPYDNKIAKNDNGSWTTAALTLPTHFVITSICEYGNYLAIGVSSVSGVGASKVFLWDRDASLTTLSDSIDWGEGTLTILEEVEGVLMGISQTSGLATSFSGFPNSAIRFKDRVIFRTLVKGGAKKVAELIGSTSTQLPLYKQKVDNRLYFQMIITLNGAVREGVWSIGRNELGQYAPVHERTPNNATALTSGQMKGFIIIGDYMFISYIDNGDYALSKTDDTEAYTTSIYETKIYNAGDSSLKKDLLGITAMTEPLDDSPAGQVVVKYKVNAETSYTTIMTHDTDSAISDSAVNIESTGAALPKDYKEISFRLESTGAKITSFGFLEDITGKRAY